MSTRTKLGGSDCTSFSALSLSCMFRVYKNLEHLILNLVEVPDFLILTLVASGLCADSKGSEREKERRK
jgi:hypothetical protein